MDNDDTPVLVCMTTDKPPGANSYQANCDECDQPIWVAHTSSVLLTLTNKKICLQCFEKQKSDFELMMPEGEQLEELMRELRMTKEQVLEFAKDIKRKIEHDRKQ